MSNVFDARPHNLGAAMEKLRGKWGAIVAFGALLMLLGLASLIFAFESTIAMVTINGVFFIVAGAAEIGVGMHAQAWSRFFFWVLGGLLYIVTGIICILEPIFASTVLTLILGAGLVAAGVVRATLAFQLPSGPNRSMVLLGSLVTFLLGLMIVVNWPMSAIYVLGTLLGVDLLFHGAGWVNFGVGLRAHGRRAA